MIYSLITTAKMNNVDPQAWLADILGRIANHTVHRIEELMPWNWIAPPKRNPAAQAA
jgi:transposase